MRYRPFGKSGLAVSSVSLALTDVPSRPRASDWTSLVFSAMESGINTFEVVGSNPAILDGLAEAVRNVDRHLLFLGLRLGNSPTRMGRDFTTRTMFNTVEAALARTGIEYLDLVMLDDPATEELSPEALGMLKDLRGEGRAHNIGVAGEGEAMDAYISTNAFDVLSTPYNLLSGWRDRHRIKAAQERDMPVIAYDFYSSEVQALAEAATAPVKGGWFRKAPVSPLAQSGTYAFLGMTNGWTAEEICLSFTLTEPCVATVQLTADRAEHMTELATATERDLPPGVASRIEMARFGTTGATTSGAGKA